MKIYRNCVVFVALLFISMPLSVSADSLKLYAAGSLKAALDDVREMAAPGQPALRAMLDQQNKAAEADDLESKAQRFIATAHAQTDKAAAAQYMDAAAELNKRANALRAQTL